METLVSDRFNWVRIGTSDGGSIPPLPQYVFMAWC